MNKTILYPFVGDSVGGSQINTINIIKQINKKKYNLRICLMNNGPLTNFLISNKIDYEVLFPNEKYLNSFLFLIRKFFYISNFLLRNKVKIIHTNDLRMHYFWIPFCFIFRIKHIWQQHSAYYSRKNIIYSRISHRILTVSEFCKGSFTYHMSKRAVVVKNFFKPINIDKKRRINFRKNFIITFIGNNNKQKRLNIFLSIAEKLVAYYKEKILIVIVGDIKNLNEIIKKFRITNYKYYKFSNEIELILKSSSLLIAPSINEGFGRIIIESMLMKTMVLASRSGGHKEIITDYKTGFLADPDNIDDFYKKTIDILSLRSKEKKKIINAALKFAKKNFVQDDIIDEILNTYKCQKKY